MHASAVVLAAGKGRRFLKGVSKPLVRINKRPLIAYSLKVLQQHRLINEIIVVANKDNAQNLKKITRSYPKVSKVVLGGARRQDSVRSGLAALSGGRKTVLIHDSARPFINGRMVSQVLAGAFAHKAAIVGVPVKATIKKVAESQSRKVTRVKETVERNGLWEIQTPQAFDTALLLKAYRKFGRFDVTDDAMLVEKSGIKPIVIAGNYYNIKITTPEDLLLAKAIALKR